MEKRYGGWEGDIKKKIRKNCVTCQFQMNTIFTMVKRKGRDDYKGSKKAVVKIKDELEYRRVLGAKKGYLSKHLLLII